MLAMYILGEKERRLLEVSGESGVALDAGVLGQGGGGEGEGEDQQQCGADPWSARVPRDPLLRRLRPTGASAADQGVRPTWEQQGARHFKYPRSEKVAR